MPSELPPKKRLVYAIDHKTVGELYELVKVEEETLFAKYDRFAEKDKKFSLATQIEEDFRIILPFEATNPIIASMPLPQIIEDYGTDVLLIEEIRAFIRKWVDLDPRYEQLLAFYVLFTYIYEDFMEVPYLHILADLGGGKSRLSIDVLGNIVFRPIRTIGASSMSSLFRIMNEIRGTLILDEMDLKESSDKTSDIVQMLNTGYKKGVPILRCEGGNGKKYNVLSFNVFCPKILVSREKLRDDALESRCLPIRLKETNRTDIPPILTTAIEKDSQGLRNKLLLWRFHHLGKGLENVDYSFAQLNISARLKQLLLVFSSVVSDPDTKEMLKQYALEVNRENANIRGESWEGQILECIKEMTPKITPKGLEFRTLEIANLMSEKRDKKVSANSIGRSIRAFNWETVHNSEGQKVLRISEEEFNSKLIRFGLAPLSPLPKGIEILTNLTV